MISQFIPDLMKLHLTTVLVQEAHPFIPQI